MTHPSRIATPALLAVALFVLSPSAADREVFALDQVPAPPAEEAFDSPSGTYRFVLYAPADWQSQAPEGELFVQGESGRTSLWRRSLPQSYRARFAVVSDRGQVVMLDDWWNRHSRHAVVLLDRAGRDGAIWNFDQVVAALGKPARDVMALARHGPWIAAPPRFDAAGERVLVPAGGSHLAIDPDSGALSVQP